MTVYLTRHGQSLSNVGVYPHIDPLNRHGVLSNDNIVLTIDGIRQAINYGEIAKTRDIAEIVASPLARAKQTAYTIAGVIGTMVPITVSEGLAELSWENGMLPEEEIAALEALNESLHPVDRRLSSRKTMMKSIETQRGVFDRSVKALVVVCERALTNETNILAVSHFFPLRAAWAVNNGTSVEDMVEFSPSNLHDMIIDPEHFIKKARTILAQA